MQTHHHAFEVHRGQRDGCPDMCTIVEHLRTQTLIVKVSLRKGCGRNRLASQGRASVGSRHCDDDDDDDEDDDAGAEGGARVWGEPTERMLSHVVHSLADPASSAYDDEPLPMKTWKRCTQKRGADGVASCVQPLSELGNNDCC